MKWFQHDTDASFSEGLDAFMDALKDKRGYGRYAAKGRWFTLLEIIGTKLNLKPQEYHGPWAEYSIPKWSSLLGLKQKQLITYVELTEKYLRTKVVINNNVIRIEVPNLLEKIDNYQKKYVLTTDTVRTNNKEKEKESPPTPLKGGANKELNPNTSLTLKRKERTKVYTLEHQSEFDRFWNWYPIHLAKQKAIQAFNKLSDSEIAQILAVIPDYKFDLDSKGDPIHPYAATWLNGKRWQDEPTNPKKKHDNLSGIREWLQK